MKPKEVCTQRDTNFLMNFCSQQHENWCDKLPKDPDQRVFVLISAITRTKLCAVVWFKMIKIF